jgi:hypothetical protein
MAKTSQHLIVIQDGARYHTIDLQKKILKDRIGLDRTMKMWHANHLLFAWSKSNRQT